MTTEQQDALRALIPVITKDITWFLEKVVEKRLNLWVEETIKCAKEKANKTKADDK